jgi:hypothetical protein
MGIQIKRVTRAMILIGLITFLLINYISIKATDQATNTYLLSDQGIIGANSVFTLTVYVYTGSNPVNIGEIRITDTLTGEYKETTILDGVVNLIWETSSNILEGSHLFLAEYFGILGYSNSNGSCIVIFENINPGSTRYTSLDVTINSTSVYKNSSLNFVIDLSIHYKWWFRGGYVTVKNLNLRNSTIFTYGPLEDFYPGTDPSVLSIEFSYLIPIFSEVGKNHFQVVYTGSSQSQTLPSESPIINVTVLSSGYWLNQDINSSIILRSQESMEINTTILGDDPNGLILKTYYMEGFERKIISSEVLTNRFIRNIFNPNSSVSLGNLEIHTELLDTIGTIYANHSFLITIQVMSQIHYTLNSSIYQQNQTIRFEVYVTLKDIYTSAIQCDTELFDLTDGNRSLENKSTNDDGFVVFNYLIPYNVTVGEHQFGLRVLNTDINIVGAVEIIRIPIRGKTQISLTYETGIIQRSSYTQIQVTVLSGGITLSKGFVSLQYSNRTIIENKSNQPGMIFDYFVPSNHPIGIVSYWIHYSGYENFEESQFHFSLTVFSTPHITNYGQNASEALPGQIIRFWGYLIEESGTPVQNAEISVSDITTGELIERIITNADGWYIFDILIDVSSQIGLHLIEFKFSGDFSLYYNPSTNIPILTLTILPSLSVWVEKSMLANYWAIIELEGRINDYVNFSWLPDGGTEWEYVDCIQLNSNGKSYYNWSTPDYKGGLTCKVTSQNNTKFDHTIMYKIPLIFINGSETGNVNEAYHFTINSTEIYQIWIDSILWMNWESPGNRKYSYTFDNRGFKNISIISNDSFVYYRQISTLVKILEDVMISFNVPTEALVNTTLNIDGQVLGEFSGPIADLDTLLLLDGMMIAVDSTNELGSFDFAISLPKSGNYLVTAQTRFFPENFYNPAISNSVSLLIHPLPPVLQIISPKNGSTHGSFFEISFSGDTQDLWYYIEPFDSFNNTWNETLYRDLSEGNYSCHLYGNNSYGVESHIFSFFTIDLTLPSIEILSPRNRSYNTNYLEFSYLTNENNFSVYLDGENLGKIPTGYILSDLYDGSHNLTIILTDLARNKRIKTVFFFIDTIPPKVDIISPQNRVYNSPIYLNIISESSPVFYSILSANLTNQTYFSPFLLDIPIGNHTLLVYGSDEAKNIFQEVVSFSIAPSMDVISKISLFELDRGGNYRLETQIESDEVVKRVGVYLNGSFGGNLIWDLFHQVFHITLSFEHPGIWQITVYVESDQNKFDFEDYQIIWIPPVPKVTAFEASIISFVYDIQVEIDSESVPLDRVSVRTRNISYSLSYNTFYNKWSTQIALPINNYSFIVSLWYPWDETSTEIFVTSTYYGPSLIADTFLKNRKSFSCDILVVKMNSSLPSESPIMQITSYSENIEISGELLENPLSGTYQLWRFLSPQLDSGFYNISVNGYDIYKVMRVLKTSFNSTDSSPRIKEIKLLLLKNTSTGSLFSLRTTVVDDYSIPEVYILINERRYPVYQINTTFFGIEFFLTEGYYNTHLLAIDDVEQEMVTFIKLINVVINNSNSNSNVKLNNSTNNPSETLTYTNSKLNSKFNEISVIELVFIFGIFTGLIIFGNTYLRKRRMMNQ